MANAQNSKVILSEAKDLALKVLLPYLTSARVWARTVLHAATGGAIASLSAHFASPTDFDWSAAGLLHLKKVAIGGAVIALLHAFMKPPKPGETGGQQQ
jgi:hypothetical protein